MTFKDFMENLWGDIPVVGRKPSDGPGGLATNPSSPGGQQGAGGGMGMPVMPQGGKPPGPPPGAMMMKKKMKKR